MSALRIESLGHYLPEQRLTTAEVLQGCETPLRFPFQKITGIAERRIASESESALDLAEHAVRACLARSAYRPDEIDLLLCSSTSRTVENERFGFDPSHSLLLKRRLGLPNAWCFDVANACAGMFTAAWVAEALIKTGRVRTALVVSGEHVTPLLRAAQREVSSFSDPKVASLTLGDAGVAMVLDGLAPEGSGFVLLDLFTQAEHSGLCVTLPSPTGGAVMSTDAVRLGGVATKAALDHFLASLGRVGAALEDFDRVIMHQTSRTTLRGAAAALQTRIDRPLAETVLAVENLAGRGNTASTSQLLALSELREEGRIGPSEKIAFSITGSGLTVGTALYVPSDEVLEHPAPRPALEGVKLLSIGMARATEEVARPSTVELARLAVERCLSSAAIPREDLGLLLFTGVHRTDFIYEPSIAAMLAKEVGLNCAAAADAARQTFAFDVVEGGLGPLAAFEVARASLGQGRVDRVLVVSAEIDDGERPPGTRSGIAQTATAFVLEPGGTSDGFSDITFFDPEPPPPPFSAHVAQRGGRSWLEVVRDERWEDDLVERVSSAVVRFMRERDLKWEDFTAFIPPLFSVSSLEKLHAMLDVPMALRLEPTWELTGEDHEDHVSSSLGVGFLLAKMRLAPGDPARFLIAQASAGGQTACALYAERTSWPLDPSADRAR